MELQYQISRLSFCTVYWTSKLLDKIPDTYMYILTYMYVCLYVCINNLSKELISALQAVTCTTISVTVFMMYR